MGFLVFLATMLLTSVYIEFLVDGGMLPIQAWLVASVVIITGFCLILYCLPYLLPKKKK